jgi:hypothetical protein
MLSYKMDVILDMLEDEKTSFGNDADKMKNIKEYCEN